MPVHDWSNVPPGLFHHFHQFWSVTICNALNDGRLPKGHFALVEQHAVGVVPGVLTLHRQGKPEGTPRGGSGLAVADAPPKTRLVHRAEEDLYVAKANRIVVRSSGGQVVAVIEIVSPGNKANRHALRSLVEKTLDLLRQEVNVAVIDLLSPTPRDPQGIHKAIWDEIWEEAFQLPSDKPLTLASYVAGMPRTAYVETVAVGDVLPDLPLFLDPQIYVRVPLEQAYESAWALCPAEFREAVQESAGG